MLLRDPSTNWKTLDVLYEEPHVERVWTQLGKERIYLHRIHPCKRAFFHPHPWPSAVVLLTGQYRMDIGFGSALGPPPPIAASLDLKAGSGYEMLLQNSWHNVKPYGGPSLSVMLSGQPWVMPVMQHAQKAVNRYLDDDVKNGIIQEIWDLLSSGGTCG